MELAPEAIGPDLRRRMQSAEHRAERLNALRISDIRLQRADPGYATRAGANNAHFLLARTQATGDEVAYGRQAVQPGAEINAVGVYRHFHLAALQKAARAGRAPQSPGLSQDARRALLLAALAAEAVRQSLAQVIDASQGRLPDDLVPLAAQAPAEPEGFDVCRQRSMPPRAPVLQQAETTGALFTAVQKPMPVPALGAGLGAMPRFRAELGPFIGLAGSADARWLHGGFDARQTERGRMTGLDVSLRLGLGLEGVIGESGDGLAFVSAGVRADGASSSRFLPAAQLSLGGGLLAAVPARSGPSFRVRLPFFLVPGDLLLLSPLALAAPEAYARMAVTASNGGLIPWQLGMATSLGRFQVVLGREVGHARYGRHGGDQFFAPAALGDGVPRLVRARSSVVDLPILEYRPFRAFAGSQSASLLFQLFAAADRPAGGVDLNAATPTPVALRTVWSLGLRMVFEGRYYR